MLPPKEDVQTLKNFAMRSACIGHDIVDHADFEHRLATIYNTEPADYSPRDWTFTSLVYSIMALARRFETSDEILPHFEKSRLKEYVQTCLPSSKS